MKLFLIKFDKLIVFNLGSDLFLFPIYVCCSEHDQNKQKCVCNTNPEPNTSETWKIVVDIRRPPRPHTDLFKQ